MSFFFENSDEFVADDFAFLLRVGDPCQLAKKTLSRIYSHDMQAELVTQVLLDFLEFILAQHAIIDEVAGEAGGTIAVAQSTINQRSRYGGVPPAGERASRAASADSVAYRGNSGINEMLWSPIGLSVADVEYKIAQNFCAHPRVAYFGMKLHGKHLLHGILNCSKRIGRLGYERKAGRQLHCFVAMRHPDF